jgi:branched-chain amino acid transport system substrate-binding protein
MTARKRWGAFGVLLALVALASAAVGTGVGGSQPNAQAPIVIGWAYDSKGNMSPFDGPALAAAKIRVQQLNARGGVNGRPFRIDTCDTNNNNAAKAKSCAASLLDKGADVIFTTCDVDLATPVVQESIKRGKLTLSTCIGTDQMGPKRFGKLGRLAFSFGNVAQDEGSAMAEYAWRKGWRTAKLATNTYLVYFKNVVQAFEKRFTQLGGKISGRESYATGANNVTTAVGRLNGGSKADVIVTATAFGELPALVSGLRSLGNQTPILNSWAGDGTYWAPKSPQVTNYYLVTYASVFGDDPNKAVRALAKQIKAGTGGFLGGAGTIDGLAAAIKRSGGSTNGATLAATMEKFRRVPTISGLVSFSAKFHSVFGRQYRVIRIENNKGRYVGAVTAKVVPTI